jgi:ubiquinone/menaquinone biosynthesis C-methylase UbiE
MHPGGLRLTDRAVRLAALKAGMHAADIGCGTGATSVFLREKHNLNVVGLEISETLIDIGLKNHPGLNLIRWDCQTLPFEPHSLDAIFFECTLSLLGDVRQILTQTLKALKNSGSLIISDVCAKRRVGTGDPLLLTSGELAEVLADSGFDIIAHADHTAALRTYAAELWGKTVDATDAAAVNGTFDAGCFFGGTCDISGVRFSDLGYTLIIARKNKDG